MLPGRFCFESYRNVGSLLGSNCTKFQVTTENTGLFPLGMASAGSLVLQSTNILPLKLYHTVGSIDLIPAQVASPTTGFLGLFSPWNPGLVLRLHRM